MSKNKKKAENTIALNKKARHDYFIEETIEAGIMLEGWEVKSLRAGRVQLTESYVIIKKGEAWLLGCQITPLNTAASHIKTDPIRTRKLLLHSKQLDTLMGKIDQKGYTLVALSLYWKKHLVKCAIGLAKGKKQHDKRATLKERDWSRDKARLLKNLK